MNKNTCSVPDCTTVVKCKQLCEKHYTRLRNHGDVNTVLRVKNQGRECSHEGCVKKAVTKLLCSNHRQIQVTQERRKAWIAEQGGKCAHCGATEQLEIDHVDRDEKSAEIAALWTCSATVRAAELAKCQLLCVSCHREKTSSEFVGGHGTVGRYRRGCRCKVCRSGMAERSREYYRRRKVHAGLLAA